MTLINIIEGLNKLESSEIGIQFPAVRELLHSASAALKNHKKLKESYKEMKKRNAELEELLEKNTNWACSCEETNEKLMQSTFAHSVTRGESKNPFDSCYYHFKLNEPPYQVLYKRDGDILTRVPEPGCTTCAICGEKIPLGTTLCPRCQALFCLSEDHEYLSNVLQTFWPHCPKCGYRSGFNLTIKKDTLEGQCDICGKITEIDFSIETLREYIKHGIVMSIENKNAHDNAKEEE